MLNRERRDRKNEKDECQNERDPKYTFRSNQIQRFQTRELGSRTESNKKKLLKDASFIAQGNLFFLDLHRL